MGAPLALSSRTNMIASEWSFVLLLIIAWVVYWFYAGNDKVLPGIKVTRSRPSKRERLARKGRYR